MKNQGVILTIGISLTIFGLIIWYISSVYLPNEKKKAEAFYQQQYQTEKVFMVNNDLGLYSDTMISEDLFTQKTIVAVDVPKIFLPKDLDGKLLVYTEQEKEQMLRNKTSKKLVKGEYILKKALDNSPYPDDQQFKRRREYNFTNNVAGEVKTGSLVDVLVNYKNGDYDVVISKVKVERVISSAPTDENAQPAVGSSTVILSVDEVQFRDMELAQKLGTLDLRVYNDEEQLSSLETFKYAEMRNLITTIARNNNLTGEIINYGTSAYIGFLGDKTDISEKLKARLAYYKEQLELNNILKDTTVPEENVGQ